MDTYIIELQSETPPRVFIGDSVAVSKNKVSNKTLESVKKTKAPVMEVDL